MEKRTRYLVLAALAIAGPVIMLDRQHSLLRSLVAWSETFVGSKEVVLPEGGPPDPKMVRASQDGAEQAARLAASAAKDTEQ